MDRTLSESARKLNDFFRRHARLAIAFSGGLDSRFLCHAAGLHGCDVLAIHARGPHIPLRETTYAMEWARRSHIPLRILAFNPLELPEIANNARNRCYVCKKSMLTEIFAALGDIGEDDRIVCDGGNLDDMGEFRPGRKAVAELGIISPLAEAGLCKAHIRKMAALAGLENPNQTARPCLLTRFAYGMAVDTEMLKKVADAEKTLESYFQEQGIVNADFRLRLTPAPLLQTNIKLEKPGNARAILAACSFSDCEIRCGEPVSGFFDSAAQN